MNIKDIIKDNTANFSRLRHGVAYYTLTYAGTLYSFPVELSDIGDATLNASDKAIYFMRYIREAIANKTFVPEA